MIDLHLHLDGSLSKEDFYRFYPKGKIELGKRFSEQHIRF